MLSSCCITVVILNKSSTFLNCIQSEQETEEMVMDNNVNDSGLSQIKLSPSALPPVQSWPQSGKRQLSKKVADRDHESFS
jgi:hypothetical protein